MVIKKDPVISIDQHDLIKLIEDATGWDWEDAEIWLREGNWIE